MASDPQRSHSPTNQHYLRHRLRERVGEWARIGASGQVLSWIKKGVRVQWRQRPPPPFNQGVSLADATPDQLAFLEPELERLTSIGAFEESCRPTWVSKLFLVPKPGSNKWRLIVDLRQLNSYCKDFSIKYETLRKLRHLAHRNDWCYSLDLQDGYYAVGIHLADRDYFTVNIRGQLYRLACLPMGWNASPYVFCTLMKPVVRYLRSPHNLQNGQKRPSRHFLRGNKQKGIRLLPFLDDFLFLASSREQALLDRDRVEQLLTSLGLARNLKKGVWEPTQTLEHLGLEVDTLLGEFRAPQSKLQQISLLAKTVLCRASRDKRWVPVKLLAQLAGKAQFLYLAIPAARFYLRELHNVASTRQNWSSRVKLTNQAWRDLEWWKQVPSRNNRKSMFRNIETAYLHTDSSGYGWGAVLNGHQEARGLWYEDRSNHITFKELKAVRYAVESFLPLLVGRNILLHEDNQAVVAILTHTTTRSPDMMRELRKLWLLLDENDITIRPRYIRSAANIWADRLSREVDLSDWQFNPRLFRYLDKLWGPHTIDRFASMENRLTTRYNSRWNDPHCEAVDCLHLSDSSWRQEQNWCNPPWELLDDLVAKLFSSGAAATVIAPAWENASWFQQLRGLAHSMLIYPPARDIFFPGRSGAREGVGMPHWNVAAFQVLCRHS